MSFCFKTAKLTIIILLILYETVKAGRVIKFKSGSSRFNPKYFANFTIDVKNAQVNLDMFIIEPIVRGFMTNMEFQRRLSNSKNYQTLFSYTLDVCNLVMSLKASIFKKWFESLLRNGNFMSTCPVAKDHYYLNAWQMDSSLVPSYLMPGDYRLLSYCYYGKYKSKSEKFVVEIIMDTVIAEA